MLTPDTIPEPPRRAAVHVIIPARLESSRLRRKLLLSETGKPLIQHTYESAIAFAASIAPPAAVHIATDSREITAAARAFNAEVIETSKKHASGTSRIIEAVGALEIDCNDIVINLQADEPEATPEDLRLLVAVLESVKGRARIATLASTVITNHDLHSPNRAKAAVGRRTLINDAGKQEAGRAWYFSRAPIRGALAHIGIYAFRAGVLRAIEGDMNGFPARPEPLKHPLADAENLEQLAWMEDGHAIAVGITNNPARGIDTLRDYENFVVRYLADTPL